MLIFGFLLFFSDLFSILIVLLVFFTIVLESSQHRLAEFDQSFPAEYARGTLPRPLRYSALKTKYAANMATIPYTLCNESK
jgi:hypothetical protein